MAEVAGALGVGAGCAQGCRRANTLPMATRGSRTQTRGKGQLLCTLGPTLIPRRTSVEVGCHQAEFAAGSSRIPTRADAGTVPIYVTAERGQTASGCCREARHGAQGQICPYSSLGDHRSALAQHKLIHTTL